MRLVGSTSYLFRQNTKVRDAFWMRHSLTQGLYV